MSRAEHAIGLYLHTPFCNGKCPYCDFYSTGGTELEKEEYAAALARAIRKWGEKTDHRAVDTVYFGGGTPVLLGTRLCNILACVAENFSLAPGAEITVEANPTEELESLLPELQAGGFNRLSIGLQSSNESELRFLGRRHSANDAAKAVRAAQSAGFENISLDLMLGLEDQTVQSLQKSVDFCASLGVQHISAYLLKVEPDTPFGKREESLHLPDEEVQRELYLAACERLEKHGFFQYEISNFALPGKESQHNLKYWNGEEYLGIGPAAHSFLDGERFWYPRDTKLFCAGGQPCADGPGGDFEEYAMLCLRLAVGLRECECNRRFGHEIPQEMRRKAERLKNTGLICSDLEGIRLTREGFLVSNAVIGSLLDF